MNELILSLEILGTMICDKSIPPSDIQAYVKKINDKYDTSKIENTIKLVEQAIATAIENAQDLPIEYLLEVQEGAIRMARENDKFNELVKILDKYFDKYQKIFR